MTTWLYILHIHGPWRLRSAVHCLRLHRWVLETILLHHGIQEVIVVLTLVGLVDGLVKIVSYANLAGKVAVDSVAEGWIESKTWVEGIYPSELHWQVVVFFLVHFLVHDIFLSYSKRSTCSLLVDF